MKRARQYKEKIGAIHLRHVHPLPNGLEKIFARFKRVVVVEMNDEGVYGFGQLATILRARFCEPKIESFTKTDGLTFRVREILEGIFHRKFPRIIASSGTEQGGNGAAEKTIDLSTVRAGAQVSTTA